MRLAEALPESRPPVNNGYREMLPALLELANGVRCGVALEKNIILTMEHEEIVTEKSGEFPYVCADGTRAGNQMSFADGKFQFVRNVRLDVTSDGTPTSVSSTIIPIRTIWGAGAEVIAPIPVWVDEP